MYENNDRPHVKPGPIRYTKGYRSRVFMSKFFTLLIALAFLSVTALFIFIFYKQPLKTEDGYITAKPAFESLVPGDSVIVVEEGGTGVFVTIKRFFIEQKYYKAKVIAGPHGEIKQIKGAQSIDNGTSVVGVNLGDIQFEEGEAFLDSEYVVRKIDENEDYKDGFNDEIIKKEDVLGFVIKK